jgi:hypothetical protein
MDACIPYLYSMKSSSFFYTTDSDIDKKFKLGVAGNYMKINPLSKDSLFEIDDDIFFEFEFIESVGSELISIDADKCPIFCIQIFINDEMIFTGSAAYKQQPMFRIEILKGYHFFFNNMDLIEHSFANDHFVTMYGYHKSYLYGLVEKWNAAIEAENYRKASTIRDKVNSILYPTEIKEI